jgi:biotin-dependent carboxylase-like uncharacterized protein
MIKVLASGFYTSIQDLGRKGFANIGVLISGAMDLYSATLANQLLNNNENDAVLEITFGGCKLEFQSDCVVCITGADFLAKIDEKSIKNSVVVSVKKGSVLSFGKRNYGVRTYVAVFGGFQTDKILKSRSFYKGITKQNVLKKGDLLAINPNQKINTNTFSSIKLNKNHFQSKTLMCFKGPEFNLLSTEQIQQLKNTEFSVSSDNNRMGYRLYETLENDFKSMLTSSVLQGTIQLTPSGKLIVLMRDCQVTGGYPRILQLSEKAINQLAQKTTNDKIKFQIK